MSKAIRNCLLIGLVALALPMGAAQARLVDAVVATVGDEPILYSELLEEAAPLLSATQDQQERQQILQDVLNQAIEQKILYREAQLAGLQVPDKAVEERLNAIKKQYQSEQEFMQVLKEAGETVSDFRQRLRKQIMAISMGMQKRREFEADAVVSESDMLQYYQDHQDEFSHPERVRLRRIFLPAGDDPAERARVKARLETLKHELELGADFAELAQNYSKGPEASEGGLVGWVQRGDLVPALEEVVFSLQPGEVSDVVSTEYGFHLLKAEAREEAGLAPFDEVRTEIEPKLREQYAAQRYRKWMDSLRERSQVRVLL